MCLKDTPNEADKEFETFALSDSNIWNTPEICQSNFLIFIKEQDEEFQFLLLPYPTKALAC